MRLDRFTARPAAAEILEPKYERFVDSAHVFFCALHAAIQLIIFLACGSATGHLCRVWFDRSGINRRAFRSKKISFLILASRFSRKNPEGSNGALTLMSLICNDGSDAICSPTKNGSAVLKWSNSNSWQFVHYSFDALEVILVKYKDGQRRQPDRLRHNCNRKKSCPKWTNSELGCETLFCPRFQIRR